MIDMTGWVMKEHGVTASLITVTSFANVKNGRAYWNCLCECGNIFQARGDAIRNGHTKSCGCHRKINGQKQAQILGHANFKDITGLRFGKLTVISRLGLNNHGHYMWKCQCDCGNLCQVDGTKLRNGHTQSCGCLVSKGEQKIHSILQQHHIPFETQKSFKTCKFTESQALAKFDFFVNNHYVIEYDGEQHFVSRENGIFTKERVQKIQQRDMYKNQWCTQNNIPLIRIPYWHYKNLCLNDLLLETSNFII